MEGGDVKMYVKLSCAKQSSDYPHIYLVETNIISCAIFHLNLVRLDGWNVGDQGIEHGLQLLPPHINFSVLSLGHVCFVCAADVLSAIISTALRVYLVYIVYMQVEAQFTISNGCTVNQQQDGNAEHFYFLTRPSTTMRILHYNNLEYLEL